ncbi:MAG: hypothetical protein PHQ76_07145 [Caldisericia bacterium]|nr:hypothetical protein [Caldisericia bacterium]
MQKERILIKEDIILDVRDHINAIFFCLDNEMGSVSVDSVEMIDSLNSVKKSVQDDLFYLRDNNIFKSVKDKRISDILKGKFSSRVALLYKIDELKNKIRTVGDQILVSENVVKYLRNEI